MISTIIKKVINRFSFLIFISFIPTSIFSQTSNEKENVIAQMNYCINSLTNIIHNKSMSVLDHESDQILNNLTMEQIIGLYEINDFRVDLLDAINKFNITEQERALLRRIQSIKRDNMKWMALSNALDPTMLLTGNSGFGYQLAFQTLLTAARSVVEYQAMKGDQNIEELRAMWELRKEDLKEISEIRKEALKIIFSIYNKYHLKEKDRLTELTSNNFSVYISENNAEKRIRLLEDNRSIYEHIADYYYHLGMAYLDINNYNKAKQNFTIYLNMYSKAPLLRYDEKSGCIYLAILANEKKLSNLEKIYYINNALKNLPHNSAAVLQCAMIYLYELNEQENSLNLIRAGIEDPKASDKYLLYMAAANILPIYNKYPKLRADIYSLFSETNKMTFDSYITFLINKNESVWSDINKLISFENITYRRWWQLWIGKYFNDELHLILPENILYNVGDISIYTENHDYNSVTIKQLQTSFVHGVDISDLEKVDCFKANKELKYLYFDVIVPEKTFILKQNIDYNKIQKEEWHRQSEFDLSQDDISDIIDFCKDNTPKHYKTELVCENWSGEYIDKSSENIDISFYGEELKYKIHHSNMQSGDYLRIVFSNGINLMYKFENNELIPYMYSFRDKIVFYKEKYKFEYEYKEQDIVEEQSIWDKIWLSIINIFSNDHEDSNVENIDNSETKANKNTLGEVKYQKDDSNLPYKEQDINLKIEEQSFWSKVWNSITDIFSEENYKNNIEKIENIDTK